ncbi:MAG: response regulator transcription factor [Dehalococcoidales bacterium]|jgi:DNA-binding NarL/FixJ family response regulator|nr:response regulator transcription factor [Dehalococcoidales bacterium]
MEAEKIQVYIISQQSLFRKGIQHSLSEFSDIAVMGTSEISESVLNVVDNTPPDVALVDIDGSAESGLSLARKIKLHSPSVAIVVLASNPSDEQLFEVLKGQAASYLSKETTAEQLVDTIRRVARGEHPINESLTARPKVAEQVLLQFQELSRRTEAEAFISPLTPREMEILKYIGQGYLNKQIAAELGISEQTIKNHVTSILRKLNANARTEAVVLALKQGLISIN